MTKMTSSGLRGAWEQETAKNADANARIRARRGMKRVKLERLLGRGIADLSEDGGFIGAGGAGEIRRALVQGFVGHKGEGIGFLGFFGDAETGGWDNFDGGERGSELREDERIARTATRDDELLDFGFPEDEALERVHDGIDGEFGGGADEIVGSCAMLFAEAEQFLEINPAVVFAAGGFGGAEL